MAHGFKNFIRGKLPWQLRLKASIWRRMTPIQPPSDTPIVVFAIPLVSKRRAPDWDIVCRNLNATLAALKSQSSSSWKALICGQNMPADLVTDDQIQFLKSTVSDKFYDKGDKRRQIIAHMARTLKTDGYYFQLDADDLLHPELVAHICRDHNGAGYYVQRGYLRDVGRDLLAPLGPETAEFWTVCGSSTAAYFDFRKSRHFRALLNELKSHKRIISRMATYGFEMEPIHFPAGLYLVNHGQNMIERRGNLGGKLSYAEEHALEDPAEIARIKKTFRLS
ncbi:glycosyltransferase family 2 protein [Cognatishimia sp. MH4019]|uniref:glycosyltransferase family 2 protein n=1 Tax=Cognatishimia sp. MH4019 TaxID=2854030 RepID=UPI001CD461E7|nr:glycosyltransferase family 2 protein [Cognatishimia sp. MH4019]